jgi:cytochrome b561
VLPLSGYVASNFSKHGVRFFGLPVAPWGPDLPHVYDALNAVHVAAAWLFAALIAGHVIAALQHAWIDRDGIFARVWPWRMPRVDAPVRPVGRGAS